MLFNKIICKTTRKALFPFLVKYFSNPYKEVMTPKVAADTAVAVHLSKHAQVSNRFSLKGLTVSHRSKMDDELRNDSIFDVSERVDNPDSDVLLEDSFSNFVESARPGPSTSTPVKPPTAKISRKSKENATKLKCPRCTSLFANKRTLDTHLRGHFMKGVSSRGPTKDDLLENMRELLKEAILSICQDTAVGELWEQVQKYCLALLNKLESGVDSDFSELCNYLSNNFIQILQSSKVLFPSAIRASVYSGTNKILNDQEFQRTVNENLGNLVDGEKETISIVASDIIFRLSQKVAVYTMQKMRGDVSASGELRSKQSTDDVNSVTFQQLCYYIGGSVIAGYIWKVQQYCKNSEMWTSYLEVLKTKFVWNGEDETKCSALVRSYTEVRDRGGLLHLSSGAFDFFSYLV